MPRILWINFDSQNNIGFLWFLDAFSYINIMKWAELSEKTDNCWKLSGKNDKDNTYNFGGVETFGLLFLDYTIITDKEKVKIEQLKDTKEAWDTLSTQQNENWNQDVIAFE